MRSYGDRFNGHRLGRCRLSRRGIVKGGAIGGLALMGGLAWTQPDALTYVFKLRPGVRWQNIPPVNGRELVADDLVWSFKRQIAEKINAICFDGVEKIEAVDKSTLRMTRSAPDADFLANLT